MPKKQLKRLSEIGSRAKLMALLMISGAGVFAAIHTIAWGFEIPAILNLWPSPAKMAFHTAILGVVAAVGLATLVQPGSSRRIYPFAFILMILSGLSFTEQVTGIGFSFNTLISVHAKTMGFESITSPYTSFSFFVLALAILLHALPWTRRVPLAVGILSVIVSAIGIAGTVSHLLAIMPEAGLTGLSWLSFATSITLALLGSALVTMEVARYPSEDWTWAPPMVAKSSLVITIIMWQALDKYAAPNLTAANYFLFGGLLLTLLSGVSVYLALLARKNLLLAQIKEAELTQLNSELEVKVSERTQDLANSNAELERFASMAAHDLKSPINSMTQFAELLREELETTIDEDQKQYLAFISRAGERARRLIDSLLQYAKVGNLSSAANFELLEANKIAQAAEENLHFDAVSAKAEISIGNLPKHDVLWIFSVKDNGIGIPLDKTSSLFAIFSRLHSEDRYEGTGLGLAMCRRIVENHKGRIWVDSKPGDGSTFYFTLPKVNSQKSQTVTT